MTQDQRPTGLKSSEFSLADLKGSLDEFISSINDFKVKSYEKIDSQEDRLQRLDQKAHALFRPALDPNAQAECRHQKAFKAYLKSGDETKLHGLDIEQKGMLAAVNSEGGFLVDGKTADFVDSALSAAHSIRSIAHVVTVEASAYDILMDHGEMDAGWATEQDAVNDTATPKLDRIRIPLHELSAMPKASQRLLEDSAFDIENWLAGRIADTFARFEGRAFLRGTGEDQPKGFLSYDKVADGAQNWGQLAYIATGGAGKFKETMAPDKLVDLVYALDARYRAKSRFVLNSKTAGHIRKLKDSDGRFLWADGLALQEPARLLGYPVVICEDMPDIEPDAYAIAFGDFSAGYTIVERPDLRVLRDPFSAKPHVLFYATKRVGGAVTDFSAIKLLKFSTS